jgi:hypothetical protein
VLKGPKELQQEPKVIKELKEQRELKELKELQQEHKVLKEP